MKISLLAIVSLLIVGSAKAQPPAFDWVRQLGDTSGNVFIISSVTDATGNLYMTGVFTGTIDADPGVATAFFTDAGFGDIFISKIDSAGNFMWAKQIGRESYDQASSIALDAFGNVYVTGFFSRDSTDFDPGTGVFYLSNSDGGPLTFVLKLDPDGNFQWAKELGPGGNDPSSIALDKANNIFITGSFGGTVDFDPGAGTHDLTGSVDDIYILKLNAAADFTWVKQVDVNITGTRIYSIATDGSGNVYLTGLLFDTVDFDPGNGISNLTGTSIFGAEYIFKLDSSGNFAWAKEVNGSISQTGSDHAIQVDEAGNSYTAGWFNGTVDFDPNAGVTNLVNTLTTGGSTYLLKLDVSGNLAWAKQTGDPGDGNFRALRLDASGNLYLSGAFNSAGDFDPGAGTDTLSAANGSRFVAKYDGSGSLLWAVNFSNDLAGSDHSATLNVDPFGNVYTTGVFQATSDFDPGAGVFNLTSNSAEDVFIHKMNSSLFESVNDLTTEENNWSVYPNPCNGAFRLKSDEEETYTILDEWGNVVQSSFTQESNAGIVTVTGLPAGIYFVVGISQHKIGRKKVVVQK